MKKVILAVPFDSSFKNPLQNAFEQLGFNVQLFDYRTIMGNFYMKQNSLSNLFNLTKALFYNFGSEGSSSTKRQIQILNHWLREKVKDEQPDLVFVVKGEGISKKTIEFIRRQGSFTINWMVDPVFDPKIWSWFKNTGQAYDLVLLCEEGRMKEMKKLKWKNRLGHMLAACDSKTKKTVDKPRTYDIVFVGTYSKKREELLSVLTSFDLHIWGHGWEKSALAKFSHGILSYSNLLETYTRSKIVICTTQVPTISVNNRFFEASSSGALVVTNCNRFLDKLFLVGNEVVCFSSRKDLYSLVSYYLKYEEKRKKMANILTQNVLANHTYEKRLKEVLGI